MTRRRFVASLASAVFLVVSMATAAALSPALEKKLRDSKYVYVASERKGGSLGKPAEIWFFVHEGAVYVASPPATWRVKRVRAGRTKAKIWVGSRDGESFDATAAAVDDPKLHPVLAKAYAEKYPSDWGGYEKRFMKGLTDGGYVLIRYTPR